MSYGPPIVTVDPVILDLYAHINRLSGIERTVVNETVVNQGGGGAAGITEIAAPLYGGTRIREAGQFSRVVPMLVSAPMRVRNLRTSRLLSNSGPLAPWAFNLYDNLGAVISGLINNFGPSINVAPWSSPFDLDPGVYYLGFSPAHDLTGNFIQGIAPPDEFVRFPRTGYWLNPPTLNLPQNLVFEDINESLGPMLTPFVYLTSF